MTWKTISENNLPNLAAGEAAEVRLTNGPVQLAEWNGKAFVVPGMGVPMKNVAQWRSMAESDSHLKTHVHLKPLARD